MDPFLSLLEAKTLAFRPTGSYTDIVRVDPIDQERTLVLV